MSGVDIADETGAFVVTLRRKRSGPSLGNVVEVSFFIGECKIHLK